MLKSNYLIIENIAPLVRGVNKKTFFLFLYKKTYVVGTGWKKKSPYLQLWRSPMEDMTAMLKVMGLSQAEAVNRKHSVHLVVSG